ncbi:MarR family winged helix-turn-helix transcriptional regulator [Agromyces sp. Marseille-P2726]|uniref:MarR family winged helix-turn-helix transcriptional regulator n=1 Tax=Agromyces sp. Marseille-P2726 TaxID=2709132 RepID=UPI001570A417|nr:MarR family transcriptional regulator [Agromyces sp. Marseille-P2726]
MPSGRTERRSDDHYWYDAVEPSALALLESVRRHRAAEAAMRRRIRDDMDMGDTDLAALRWIIENERAGRAATSAGMSRALGITTAATVKVVGRLVAEGYIARSNHPSDRRALLLSTLPGAHERLRRALGPMHERMLRLAESLEPRDREVVIRFLERLAAILDEAPGREAEVAP